MENYVIVKLFVIGVRIGQSLLMDLFNKESQINVF